MSKGNHRRKVNPMANQKVCDGCTKTGTVEEISRRAILVSKNDQGTVHIHADVSTDQELCDDCMRNVLDSLGAAIPDPPFDAETAVVDRIYASRVQPR